MFKKIVALVLTFALVIAGMNFTPGTVDAAVNSASGSSSWKLVWNDEFNQTVGGAPDSSVWSYDIGNGDWGWGNGEIQNYTSSTNNVYIADMSSDKGSSDGRALAIKAMRQNGEITSGRLKTIGKQYLKYGKVEAKIRVTNSMQSGVWPAFWMMGNSMNSGTGWPYCGEIDIMEHRNAEQQVIGTLHWNTGTGTGAAYNHVYSGSETTGQFAHIDSMEDWHKYGIEWYENQIKFFVDDVCFQTLDTSSAEMEEFRQDYYLLLNLAIGGPDSPFTLGQTVSDSFTDATMYVDYVRVYQGTDSDFYIANNSVKETSPEPTTTGDGMTTCSSEKTSLGGWGYFIFGGNAGKYTGGSSLTDEFTLKITANNKAAWGVQAFTQNINVKSGHAYNVSVDIDSSAATGAILMKDEIGGTEMVNKGLVAGKNTFTGTFTANSDTMQLMFNLTEVNTGTTLKFSNVVVTDATGEEVPVETTVSASGSESGNEDWKEIANGNGVYFYDAANMENISGVVNIQKPGFATEQGIYITTPAGISSVSVNGKTENVAAIQGAGAVVYLSALTQKINTVKFVQGGSTSIIIIKNNNASGGEEETTAPEQTTPDTSAIAAPSEVAAYNFYAQAAGYKVTFAEVEGAVSYNVYMDNSGVLANITKSGESLAASVFSAFADGELHNLYVQSVDAQGAVSAKSEGAKVRVTTQTNSTSDPADINRIYVVTNKGGKGGEGIGTDKKKVSASLTIISGESGIKTVSNSGSIKRRGNSTSLADKPAYNISFDSKAEVMTGRAKGKKWCLLANAYEKTLIRNKLAMDLGLYAGNIAAAQEHFADLYIDGEYKGNFVISEPAECGRSGCLYDDSETSDELLFELEDNDKNEEECLYYRAPRTNVRFVTEDTVDTSSSRYQKWVSTMTSFENALVNTSSDEVFNYMDVESFVTMYVVNELFQTVDFGYSSVKFYITYDENGAPTIHAGPLWDFDLSSGNSSFAENRTYDTFRGQEVNAWFGYLMKNQTFKNKVIEKYKQMQLRIQNIYKENKLGESQITKLTKSIEASRIRNYSSKSNGGAGWSESTADGAEYSIFQYSYSTVAPYSTYTYQQHIDYLTTWLQNRNEWICSQWNIDLNDIEETTPEPTTPEPTTPEPTTPSITVSGDLKLLGYQISTSYEGVRVAAGVEPVINGQKVQNWGFVYGLENFNGNDTGITDEDMYVGEDNPYIKSYQSTSVGTVDVQLGDSKTATYFVRTMQFGGTSITALTANYKVRAYAILADGSYVYSNISDYSIARVADKLYKGHQMNTLDSHNYLYDNILSKVYEDYKVVEFLWNNTIVKPEDVED